MTTRAAASAAAAVASGPVRVRVKWAGSASQFRPLELPTDSTRTELGAACASIWGLDLDSVRAFRLSKTADADAVDGQTVAESSIPKSWLRMTASAPVADGAWVVVFGRKLTLPDPASRLGVAEGEAAAFLLQCLCSRCTSWHAVENVCCALCQYFRRLFALHAVSCTIS